MIKEEIILLLSNISTPISQIEINLGMPKTTLQKAIKGERRLPKKWSIRLREAYGEAGPPGLGSATLETKVADAPLLDDNIIDRMFEDEKEKILNKHK